MLVMRYRFCNSEMNGKRAPKVNLCHNPNSVFFPFLILIMMYNWVCVTSENVKHKHDREGYGEAIIINKSFHSK